jgi:branched-chain amino acid aminotransferase
MATGKNILTYFNGTWHTGNVPIINAADHGAWLGSNVFDGARYFNGVAPDLLAHCQRVNNSAKALMLKPSVEANDMVEIIWEGLKQYEADAAVYIRPMYWAIDGDLTAIVPNQESVGFAICLEQIPLAPESKTVSLTKTKFRRPVLEDAVVNAKAGCLYPNNARMLVEARSKGFSNALVTDVLGNVAETASANIFMVKDGEVFTPIPNGTFLSGITRARHISNMNAAGIKVHEIVLTYADFESADEIFMSGNMNKVTAVTAFEDFQFQIGSVTKKVRDLYWDWAMS